MSYNVSCFACGEDIYPNEELLETDGGTRQFHVRADCNRSDRAEANSECEACEFDRRGMTSSYGRDFDIRRLCTGAYCDDHAGQHENGVVLSLCPGFEWDTDDDVEEADFIHQKHCPETGSEPALWTGKWGDPERKLVFP